MVKYQRKSAHEWNGESIAPGEIRDLKLAVSESYSGMTVHIPVQVRRGRKEGPTVFVTAAIHGDEINGTGTIRHLTQDDEFEITAGCVLLVPVMNILAFERHSRYLPDRRDLNRCFPGTKSGSLASRMSRTIFEEIVLRSDLGIDLHTASVRRTNYPNVRGDLKDPEVKRLALAFGSEIVINRLGPAGAFRREACKAGCPTIIMEGGEVWKVEPTIVETAVNGIKNVLRQYGLLSGEVERPKRQMIIKETKWIRAERGGFLQFHVGPGDVVEKGQALTTNTTLLGREKRTQVAPFDGVVFGMTTLPAVNPGEPICQVGRLPKGFDAQSLIDQRENQEGLEERLSDDLASNILVIEPAKDLQLEPKRKRL